MNAIKNISQTINDEVCTGCWVCADICPASAIAMRENHDGFIIPWVENLLCLNCGKCVEVCPATGVANKNDVKPICFAFRADDETRMQSSSGGFFSVIAKNVLDKDGCVCGAVWDSDGGVSLIIANDWPSVEAMRGSKYVQANAAQIYKNILISLEKGRVVLFVGVPCQVAALNKYLVKPYSNLITVDLLCHGVISQALFKNHLTEMANGRKINEIAMRDKRYGWKSTSIRVEFSDGSVYEGNNGNNSFEKGYHANLFLRKSCAKCQFRRFPRQGDITIGDFWNVGDFIKDNDDFGTSAVFINNEKGEHIFNCISEGLIFAPVRCDVDLNTFIQGFEHHKARSRLFDLIKYKTLSRSTWLALSGQFDLGIVGNYHDAHFGSILTYYALYNLVKDLGYDALMIDAPGSPRNFSAMDEGSYPEYAFGKGCANEQEMRGFNNHCDKFMVGSDQLFHPNIYGILKGFSALKFVNDDRVKITFASSFGHSDISGPWLFRERRSEMAYYMQKFDAFSVREKSGVGIAKKYFDVSAEHVLDPVFLCGRHHFERFASLAKDKDAPDGPYLDAYILDTSEDKQKIIEEICATLEVGYRLYTHMFEQNVFRLNVSHGTVNKQLLDMANSRFVFTDSFHGVCFAMILEKPFIGFANHQRGYTRFESLLSDTGLMHRLVHNMAEFENRKKELLQPIDYSKVNIRLEPMIEKSIDWLKRQLAMPRVKCYSEQDMARSLDAELGKQLEVRINALRTDMEDRIKDLERRLAQAIGDARNTQKPLAQG